MNKIILIGRVTKNIELKRTESGVDIASFSLAVTRNFKNQEGEYESDFINCIAFKKLAETISSYVNKGDKLGVEGKLQTRNYTNKEGNKVYVSEVIVENIEFLQPKSTTEKVEEVEEPKEDPFVIKDEDLPW